MCSLDLQGELIAVDSAQAVPYAPAPHTCALVSVNVLLLTLLLQWARSLALPSQDRKFGLCKVSAWHLETDGQQTHSKHLQFRAHQTSM